MPTLYDLQDYDSFVWKGSTYSLLSLDDESGVARVLNSRGFVENFNAYAEVELVKKENENE